MKIREEKRRRGPTELKTAFLGLSPLHVTANILTTSSTLLHSSTIYNYLYLTAIARLSPLLCSRIVSLSLPPFFFSLESVPFNSTPSGIDPQLEVITQAKKRHLAATHPRLSLHPVLLLCEKTSRYQTLLSLLKTYLSFSSRFSSVLAGLKLPRIVNM